MSLEQRKTTGSNRIAAIKAAQLHRHTKTRCVSCGATILIPIHGGQGWQPVDKPGTPHTCAFSGLHKLTGLTDPQKPVR